MANQNRVLIRIVGVCVSVIYMPSSYLFSRGRKPQSKITLHMNSTNRSYVLSLLCLKKKSPKKLQCFKVWHIRVSRILTP